MNGDDDLIKLFLKPKSNELGFGPEQCTRLKPNMTEDEMVEEYEKMKKQTYTTSIKFGVKPNHNDLSTLVFREDAYNKNTTFTKEGIDFNVNSYVPTNLSDLMSETSTNKNIPVYFGVHGAGSSSYTFNSVCSYLKEIDPNFVFIAVDLRGHGNTKSLTSVSYNLSDFVDDANFLVFNTLKDIFGDKLSKKVSIVFLGHSLGGSVCSSLLTDVKSSANNEMNNYWKFNILGLVMLDIIEDLAVRSLAKMPEVIARTFTKFPNIKQCMNWHLGTGNPKNFESAKFSVLDLYSLKHFADDKYYLERKSNLSDFKSYWNTWFTGLSDQFINLKGVCKELILSGNDQGTQNLDKTLMIGQMQGKYQLVVFNDGGHFIHEDCDYKVAITLDEFVKRNDNKLIEIKTNWGKT